MSSFNKTQAIGNIHYDSLDELLKVLGINNAPGLWHRDWKAAISALPQDNIFFMEEDYIKNLNKYLLLPDHLLENFFDFYETAKSRLELGIFVWLWHFCIFMSDGSELADIDEWPLPQTETKTFNAMLPAVIVVSGIYYTENIYNGRNISNEIFSKTFTDLSTNMDYYKKEFGIWGLKRSSLRWMLNYLSGRLYKFGTLNFMMDVFPLDIKVFRKISTGEIIILSGADTTFRRDGHISGTNEINDNNGWVSSYNEFEEFIICNTVINKGYAENKHIKLDKREYKMELERGDNVIEVHIPYGQRLNPELYAGSFRQAAIFFEEYFPEKHFNAFSCWSWLLDPQLKKLLPDTSNIVKFQSQFNIFPVISTDSQIIQYVFNGQTGSYETMPEKTSLQRIVKNYLMEGGLLHSGGVVIMKEEVKKSRKSYKNSALEGKNHTLI